MMWDSLTYLDCGSFYPSEVLKDNPVDYWRLNDTAGTLALDSGTSGNNATYISGVTLGQPSAIFSGFSNYSALGAANAVIATIASTTSGFQFSSNVLTQEMWIKPTAPSTPVGMMVVNFPYYTKGFMFAVNQGPCANGQYKITKFNGNADICLNGWPNDSNVWHHLAVVASNFGMTVYLDGKVSATNTDTSSYVVCDNTCTLIIGVGGSAYYMEEVALYPTALSPERIQAHYNAGTICH